MAIKKDTNVIIKNARLSFVYVWEPSDYSEKYSVRILIDKSDKENLASINAAIEAAKKRGIEKVWGGKLPSKLSSPLNDGEEKADKDPSCAGCWYINAKNGSQPGVLDMDKKPMEDQSHLYSGCYAHVSVAFYAYDKNGNKGIACSLSNIMKTADGDRLSGHDTAENDFADIEVMAPTDDEDWAG